MDYFRKIEENIYQDLIWNIPERKQGTLNVIGGNSQNFKTEIRIGEYIDKTFPIEKVNLVLPDTLKNQLPDLANFLFLRSTESGSFAESQELINSFNAADFNLVLGDFSKNSVTGKAVLSAFQNSEKMTLITRDAVDLVSKNASERLLIKENIILFGSIAQFSKLLREIFYPRILLMSQSLVQIAETFHKLTLSYPINIISFHNGQIIMSQNGQVLAIPIEKTKYSPITLWSGELAAKVSAMNMFNPNQFIESSVSSLFL